MGVDEGIRFPVPEVNVSSLLCVLGKPPREPLLVCRQKTEGLEKVLRFQGEIISRQTA